MNKTAYREPEEDVDLLNKEQTTPSDPDQDLFPEEQELSASFYASEKNPASQEPPFPFQPFTSFPHS